MSLLKDWQKLSENQTKETFDDFWEKYSATEKKIYQGILADYKTAPSGTVQEMIEKYEAEPALFMGFLDGINSSLKEELELKDFEETTAFTLDIDYEKLYFNMLKAGADYLYTLEEWEDILSQERRDEILKEYKRSRTIVKEKTPGRNDPCPCGSGKKYKKCCGANN